MKEAMYVGDDAHESAGTLVLNSGQTYVTNSTHTAVLNVRHGSVLLAGGTLVVDKLIMTSSSGQFVKTGGIIIQNTSPELAANLDADRDGQSNANELRAGTDPLDPASSFRLLSAQVVNQDVRLEWTAATQHTYVVQFATNLGGPQATNFVDLSPPISVGNATQGNYVHLGAVTNSAAVLYRVRLEP